MLFSFAPHLPTARGMRLLAWTVLWSLGIGVWSPNASTNPVRPEDVKTWVDPAPKRLDGVEINERLGGYVPTDIEFQDTRGHTAEFKHFLRPELPTIVTLNYANCPMLCSLELNALVSALNQVQWSLGEHFRIVTVSLDPQETEQQATETQARYLGQYTRGAPTDAWPFLRGPEAHVRGITGAIGFGYSYNEARNEYLHPAVMAILAPDGRIVRYLYGVEYDPKTLALSLVEASEGRIGTAFERVLLYCFHFDETEGRYAPVAMNIMRMSGLLVAAVLGLVLAGFWIREWRRKAAGTKSIVPATDRGSVSTRGGIS